MSIKSMREIVELYQCDSCGELFPERKECSLTFKAGGDVIFEWWNRGDYCPECLSKLAKGIVNSFPVAERYEREARKIPMELAVIKKKVVDE